MRCRECGRDLDAIGQDNMSSDSRPLCEDCYNDFAPVYNDGSYRSPYRNQFSYGCVEDYMEEES